MSNSKHSLGKFMVGLGVGAGLGILFAPDKGCETRKKLKEKLDCLYEKVKSIDVKEVKDELTLKLDNIKKELEDLDKEKALKLAKKKAEDIKEQIEDLAVAAKKKAEPVVSKAVDELREQAIKVTKEVLKRLEKED